MDSYQEQNNVKGYPIPQPLVTHAHGIGIGAVKAAVICKGKPEEPHKWPKKPVQS